MDVQQSGRGRRRHRTSVTADCAERQNYLAFSSRIIRVPTAADMTLWGAVRGVATSKFAARTSQTSNPSSEMLVCVDACLVG